MIWSKYTQSLLPWQSILYSICMWHHLSYHKVILKSYSQNANTLNNGMHYYERRWTSTTKDWLPEREKKTCSFLSSLHEMMLCACSTFCSLSPCILDCWCVVMWSHCRIPLSDREGRQGQKHANGIHNESLSLIDVNETPTFPYWGMPLTRGSTPTYQQYSTLLHSNAIRCMISK